MRQATAIYHAPDGDAKSVTMNGVVFNDGESVDLNSDEHGHLVNKLQGNQHFEIEVGEDDTPPEKRKPGRPPKVRDFKAGLEEGRDHDFETDQRERQARRDEQALAAVPKPPGKAKDVED